MTVVTTIALAVLAGAAVLCGARLLRPGSIPDRIIALDLLLLVVASVIAVRTAMTGSGAFVNVLFVAALIAFVGTVTVARYVERRGAGR